MVLTTLVTVRVLQGLWFVFGVYWLVGAFNTKRTVYRRPWGERVLYLGAGFLLYWFFKRVPGLSVRFFGETPVVEGCGIVLTAMGVGWAIYARTVLGRNWSGWVTLKQDHTLITEGPYRFTRHPIYTGILMAGFGTLLAIAPSPAGLIAFLMMGLLLVFKLRTEEMLMMRQFPAEYPAYRERVRFAVVPFLF